MPNDVAPMLTIYRNADRNARGRVRLFEAESFVSKSPLTRKSPSSRKVFVLDVVSVPRSVPSMRLPSSISRPTSRPRSPTDILRTASSSTDYPRQDLDKFWVSSGPTVSERVQP
ncbi:hypothetical protein F4677DRAFT_337198 [Hypoxylon crocopeplum]|nr:hypothetical protein F4677DRAFT_337198 [Hypoxylon crocopeplum]